MHIDLQQILRRLEHESRAGLLGERTQYSETGAAACATFPLVSMSHYLSLPLPNLSRWPSSHMTVPETDNYDEDRRVSCAQSVHKQKVHGTRIHCCVCHPTPAHTHAILSISDALASNKVTMKRREEKLAVPYAQAAARWYPEIHCA